MSYPQGPGGGGRICTRFRVYCLISINGEAPARHRGGTGAAPARLRGGTGAARLLTRPLMESKKRIRDPEAWPLAGCEAAAHAAPLSQQFLGEGPGVRAG